MGQDFYKWERLGKDIIFTKNIVQKTYPADHPLIQQCQ